MMDTMIYKCVQLTITIYKSVSAVFLSVTSQPPPVPSSPSGGMEMKPLPTPLPVAGVVLSGFALCSGPSVAAPFGFKCLFCLTKCSTMQSCLLPCMATLAPHAPLSPVDTSQTTRNADMRHLAGRDPLHGKCPIPNRQGYQATVHGQWRIKREIREFDTPYLLMHGTADTLTLPEGSTFFYENTPLVAEKDRQLKFYEGCYHELAFEPEHEQCEADMLAFMNARLEK